MRELSLAVLDAVSGGRAGWDSCDYNSEIGINMPIEDHGAYAEAQAKAGFISLWASAQAKEQLDSFAKSVGLPNFPELQRQAAIHQQQTCQVDPTFTAMMSSSNFTSTMNNLISLSKSSGHEYAINYYGGGNWSAPYTSSDPNTVIFSPLDFFNLFFGWADVAVHTHFNAQAGLSLGKTGDIGMANRQNMPAMAVDFTQPKGTQYYCYNPNSGN
jgi:hypothetical protein